MIHSSKNSDLLKQKDADKSEFLEIRNSTAPENADALQEERYILREEYRRKLTQQLKDKYVDKYDYDNFKEAEKAVNDELDEKALSLQWKLHRDRQRTTENMRSKPKRINHETER